MPRIRSIKPGFWDSPGTAKASLRARLLFIAMWNWADDWGVGDANPKRLIGFAFPNDDDISAADFPLLRDEVSACWHVKFYEVDGRPFYSIPSWDDHQKAEKKSYKRNPSAPVEILASDDEKVPESRVITRELEDPPESGGKSAGEQRNFEHRNVEVGSRNVEVVQEVSVASRKKPIPENFEPLEKNVAWAMEKCPAIVIEIETERFKNNAVAKGHKYIDWHGAWRNWMIKAQEFKVEAGWTPQPERKLRF